MNYESDLNYIKKFQEWKLDNFSDNKYLQENEEFGLFNFLTEFKVYKGFITEQRNSINLKIKKYLIKNSALNVDEFAKKIVDDKNLESMASKVAMLYDPIKYLPLDRYAKYACFETNKYCTYQDFIARAKQMQKNELKEIVKVIDEIIHPLIKPIESTIKLKGLNIKLIRENRILDKVLWTKGKYKI
jgi:hypothetical protein